MILEPLLISTGVVAIAEIGDKTQLLAIVLAAKFRKPVPIILGILAATLLNHAAGRDARLPVARLAERAALPARRGRRLHRHGRLGADPRQGGRRR